MKKIYWIGALALLLITGAVIATMYPDKTAEAESPFGALSEERLQSGRQQFMSNCASCHGRTAQGGTSPFVSQGKEFMAPSLNGSGHAWHHSPRQLTSYIKNGSPDPQSPMKGLSDRLSDEQIQEILAYIYSMWPAKVRRAYKRHK